MHHFSLLTRAFFVMLLMIGFNGCKSKDTDPNLMSALEMAGKNRKELEKVLTKYALHESDSLKYKAAVFLIHNMPGYIYYTGRNLSDYTSYFEALRKSKNEPIEILDSINVLYGSFDLSKNLISYDIQVVDSAYLCENIELAFKAWMSFPWSRNYDFKQFCEYILPYRTDDEMITSWRTLLFEKYLPLVKGLKTTEAIKVAKILRDSLVRKTGVPRFTMIRPNGYPTVDALTSQHLTGSCDDLVQFTISLFRTFGIACSKDYIPIQGAENVGHSWVSLVDSDGGYYLTDFFGEILYVSELVGNRTILKTKVRRKTFSKNKKEYEKLKNLSKFIPQEFTENRYRFIDVTNLYSNNLTDIKLEAKDLYPGKSDMTVAFLCAPSWQDWIPIDWSTFNKDGNITFNSIDAGSILRVACFSENGIKFLSSPFIVNKQTRVPFFFSDNCKNRDLTLFTKYSIDRDIWLRDRMIGGVFEGADNPEFDNPDTLHEIKSRPYRLFTEATISSLKKYRYLRYKGAKGSFCNVAELEFLSGKNKLKGDQIGSKGSWNNNKNYQYTAALDGLTETSYDHATPDLGWVGIMPDSAVPITKIRYAPRNYDNYIRYGNYYELFVSSENGWKSLGRVKARADSLYYKGIPINGLFYLKSFSDGQNGRVFTLEDDKMLFR